MNQTKFNEGYASLISFKNNIPEKMSFVPENHIQQYHSILKLLEETTTFNLLSFYVPPNEIKPQVAKWNYCKGETSYTNARFCSRPTLMMKVDAVLSFLNLQMDSEKSPIGFNPE